MQEDMAQSLLTALKESGADPSRTLELYKAKDTQDAAEVGIVTDQDGAESITIGARLYPALIYYISGLTLLTYREQHADSLFNQAMVLMGIKPQINN